MSLSNQKYIDDLNEGLRNGDIVIDMFIEDGDVLFGIFNPNAETEFGTVELITDAPAMDEFEMLQPNITAELINLGDNGEIIEVSGLNKPLNVVDKETYTTLEGLNPTKYTDSMYIAIDNYLTDHDNNGLASGGSISNSSRDNSVQSITRVYPTLADAVASSINIVTHAPSLE